MDCDNPVDVVYLDFRKAVDSVHHKRLLLKLKRLGISGNFLKWIESFLSERKQCVHVNGKFSDWTDVASGVSQGSLLGPILQLFILYVNNLHEQDHSYCKLFADDAKLCKDLRNLEYFEIIQEDLDKLCRWTIL